MRVAVSILTKSTLHIVAQTCLTNVFIQTNIVGGQVFEPVCYEIDVLASQQRRIGHDFEEVLTMLSALTGSVLAVGSGSESP